MAENSQDEVRTFRPFFDNAPVYGHGPSLEELNEMTPLTVGCRWRSSNWKCSAGRW